MNMLTLQAAIAAALLSVAVGISAKPLVVCTEASPEGFDPVLYTTAVTADAAAETMFNRLVDFKPGTTEVVPALAKDLPQISADGLTYTFHLRDDIKFHTTDYFKPTRNLNADDVLWSFQRQLDPKHPWHTKSNVGYPYFESMGFKELLKSVEKTDDHTVVFTLTRPEAPFLADLAMAFSSIHSAEYADQLLKSGKPSDINQKPVGTGPYVFQRYQKDSNIRYAANKDYWAPSQVKLDNLIFSISVDASARMQKLRKNECQVSLNPRPADVAGLKADPKLQVIEKPGFNLGYIAYNVQHKPFDQLQVRQALDMAVNKDEILKAVYQGAGQKAVNAMPPTQWSYDETITDAPYNPEKAKELLKAAGVNRSVSSRSSCLCSVPVS